MTQAVASVTPAAPASETHRTRAARAASTSFAEVQAAAVKTKDKDKDTDATTSTDAKTSGDAPKGERTDKVEGHGYVEIVAGPRNGMFINNSGNKRDGDAFLIVKRAGREFHIYGTGEDRSVYEVGRKRATSDNGTTGSGTTGSGTTGSTGTTGSGTTATGTTGAGATSGTSAT